MNNFFLSALCLLITLLPRAVNAASDTITYHVKNYNVKGDGKTDDLPALTALFDKITKSDKPTKVIFRKKGRYRIGSHTNDLYGRIFLNRLNNVVIEGNGCKLIVHPSSRAFAAYRSNNIIIRNFVIDYSPLPYTQGRVRKVNHEKYYLEFKTEKGYPRPIVAGKEWYKGGKMIDCITANGKTRKFYQGHSWVKKVDSISKRTYAVHYDLNPQRQLRKGDYFCMKVEYPESRLIRNDTASNNAHSDEYIYTNTGTIAALGCNNLTLSGIKFLAAPLMTIVLKGCSRHTIENCSIIGTKGRIVAGNSDGIHLKGNEWQPIIRNCYIERTMDDAIHIKMSGDRITETESPRRFRISHMDISWDNTNLGSGKQIMIFNPETKEQIDTCTIATYEPINYREGTVTVNRDIKRLKEGQYIYLMPCEEALIENCNFGTQLQRAILTHQSTTIRNCKIEDNGTGLDIDLMSGGIEGPPTQRITVDGCTFKRLSVIGLNIKCPSMKYWQGGKPQLIIKNNSFYLDKGIPLLEASNSCGISLSNNTYFYNDNKPLREEVIKLHNSILIGDNTVFKKESK